MFFPLFDLKNFKLYVKFTPHLIELKEHFLDRGINQQDETSGTITFACPVIYQNLLGVTLSHIIGTVRLKSDQKKKIHFLLQELKFFFVMLYIKPPLKVQSGRFQTSGTVNGLGKKNKLYHKEKSNYYVF